VLGLALVAIALGGCPHDTSLGNVTFVRGNRTHRVSLSDCVDHTVGSTPKPSAPGPTLSADGQFAATIRASGAGKASKQTIWVTDRRSGRAHPVFSETEHYTQIGPGDTPGPIELLGWSGDDRWVLFTIDPGGSGSIAADGLTLRVVSAAGGAVHRLGVMLPDQDYLSWCGGRLVFIGGGDRVAADAKKLLVAGPPDWKPRALWNDPSRSFGSLACAPDGQSLAVLSQHSNTNSDFFATRWQLWRVAVDGAHALIDRPPGKFADESPRWSADGRSLLFVRESNGNGQLMLWRGGRVFGPIAALGYSAGYYGHDDWQFTWHA
jgi:hypothetical protein